MKKFTKYFLVAFTAVTALACNKDVQVEITPGSGDVLVFKATLDQPAKACLDGYKTIWEEGDRIAVSNGTDWATSEALTNADITDGGRCASFTVALTAADAYYAAFPASSVDTDVSPADDAITVTVPAVQNIPDGGNIASDALVQVAKTADKDHLSFHNITSFVEMVVPENGVSAIIVDAFNASGAQDKLCGKSSVSTTTYAAAATTGVGFVTLEGNFSAGQTVFATMFPQEEVRVVRFVFSKDGAKAPRTLTASDPFVLPLNGGKKVENFGTLTWSSNVITTKEQLDTWAVLAKYYGKDEVVTLGADIDYNGENWTPVNANSGTGHFAGVFDGAGHCIYNIVIVQGSEVNQGFFSTVCDPATAGDEPRVRIKELVLGRAGDDSKVDVTGNATNISAIAGRIKNVKIENVKNYVPIPYTRAGSKDGANIGGIVGRVLDECNIPSVITECKNYGDLEVSSNLAGNVYIGGIAGLVSYTSLISKCSNDGHVARSATSADKGVNCYGGIVGRTGNLMLDVNIEDCINNGTVEYTNNTKSSQMYVGGIIGMNGTPPEGSSDYNLIVSRCTNEGIVAGNNQSVASTAAVGGIIGFITAPGLVQNCTNLGSVTKKANHNGTEGCFGGIAGKVSDVGALVLNCVNGASGDASKGVVTDLVQTSNTNQRLGGIVGYGARGTYRGCTNYAPVSSQSPASVGKMYVGGIVGNNTVANVENCSNYGPVSVVGGTATHSAGGLVGLQNGKENPCNSGAGCYVKADVSCGNESNTGLVIGRFSNSADGVSVWGTSANPIVIDSACSINGNPVSASDFMLYAGGLASGITASGVASGINTIWAKLQ